MIPVGLYNSLSTPISLNFANRSISHPCFGATTGLTPEQWWHAVILTTYKTTENQNQVEEDELEALMPDVMNIFYNEVFSTKIGWRVKEDVVYTLTKLKEWRDIGAGPKIGVVSNFDERLPSILKGRYHSIATWSRFSIFSCVYWPCIGEKEFRPSLIFNCSSVSVLVVRFDAMQCNTDLDLADYFDFVLTSQQCQKEMPGRELFDEALKVREGYRLYKLREVLAGRLAGRVICSACVSWLYLSFLATCGLRDAMSCKQMRMSGCVAAL